MNPQVLLDTVKTLFAHGKGLLAMDESNPTCNKCFAKLAIPETEEARRAYRAMIATAPGLGDSISGAILYDETIRQQTSDGIPLLTVLSDAGIVTRTKVDTGARFRTSLRLPTQRSRFVIVATWERSALILEAQRRPMNKPPNSRFEGTSKNPKKFSAAAQNSNESDSYITKKLVFWKSH